jgi:hypothetical protein
MSNPVNRRRFLSTVGAGGLAAAAAVFGLSQPARATVVVGCCHLCKASSSISTCRAQRYHYEWTCRQTSTRGCTCCEGGTSDNESCQSCNNVKVSSANCDRV